MHSRDSSAALSEASHVGPIKFRHDLRHRHGWQLLREQIPKDHISHIARIFNRPPRAGADNGIGGFLRGVDDYLNVLLGHESVIGPASIFFSIA